MPVSKRPFLNRDNLTERVGTLYQTYTNNDNNMMYPRVALGHNGEYNYFTTSETIQLTKFNSDIPSERLADRAGKWYLREYGT